MAKKTIKAKVKRARVVRRPAAAPKAQPRPAREKAASRKNGDSASTPDAARGKYVYCVIQSADVLSFGAAGIGDNGSEIHTVHYRDLAAVVSDVPFVMPMLTDSTCS